MEERTQELVRTLREAGLRCTAPRLRLIRFLARLPGHFSAEEVLRELSTGGEPGPSRATVYRFLSELERLGVLRRAQLAESHGHYEFAETEPEHCHLVCARCGRVVEMPSPALQRQARRFAREQGFGAGSPAVEIRVRFCDRCQPEDSV